MGQLRRNAVIGAFGVILIGAAVISVGSVKASSPVIELGQSFGAFSVTNPGAAASLSSAVAVQRLVAGKWADTNVTNLYLSETCGTGPPPACRKLASPDVSAPLSVLVLAGWMGQLLRVLTALWLRAATGKRSSDRRNLKKSPEAPAVSPRTGSFSFVLTKQNRYICPHPPRVFDNVTTSRCSQESQPATASACRLARS